MPTKRTLPEPNLGRAFDAVRRMGISERLEPNDEVRDTDKYDGFSTLEFLWDVIDTYPMLKEIYRNYIRRPTSVFKPTVRSQIIDQMNISTELLEECHCFLDTITMFETLHLGHQDVKLFDKIITMLAANRVFLLSEKKIGEQFIEFLESNRVYLAVYIYSVVVTIYGKEEFLATEESI